MPGNTVLEDIELIIEDLRGGGGKLPPPEDGRDGGDGGRFRRSGGPASRRYPIAIGLAMASIFVFFLAMVAAFLFLEHVNPAWTPTHLPRILWANTFMLLASSVTLELARRSLASAHLRKFQILWRVTTALGILFLTGQIIAWWELVHSGLLINTLASSFFYLFTGAHGVHLAVGVAALLYVSLRKFEGAKISRAAASQVATYYWHFMDGLWVLLFALLYLGR